MKSRIAVTLMLVFGLGLSTTGAGLAVTGSSGQGSAAQAVYPQPTTTPLNPTPTTATQTPAPQAAQQPAAPQGQVAEQTPAPQPEDANQPEDAGGVAGVQDESDDTPANPVRVAEQAAAADATVGDSLPFTGFSAIPVLLLGLALMVGGALMHRRTRVGGI